MTEVRRDDYASMSARARALLEAGNSQDEVLRGCYGVPFPDETFAMAELIAEDKEPGNGLYTNRPWKLLIPLDRGGPPAEPTPLIDGDEKRVFGLDSSLVPLMVLYGEYYEYGGVMLCYRLEELEARRSTIFGFQSDLSDGAVAKRYGDSLAAVLHASFADSVRRLEKEYASPNNRGAGSLDKFELDGERKNLACVDELIRRVAERKRPKLVP